MHHHLYAKMNDFLKTVLLGIGLSVLFISISCNKEDDPGDPSQPIFLFSWFAYKYTIVPG